jgi:hypothetical protein
MAVGSYGTIRPADVSPSDVEIYFHYVSDRSATSPVNFKKLDSEDVLTPVYHNGETTDEAAAVDTEILGGLYNLKLDSGDFDEIGIYTLHIRPKQIRTSITDCGVASTIACASARSSLSFVIRGFSTVAVVATPSSS